MRFFDIHAPAPLLLVYCTDDARTVYIINNITITITTTIIIIYNIECTCHRSDVFCLVYIKIYIGIRYTFDVWFFRLLYFFL